MAMKKRALILGSGGSAANSWEIGLITGLAEAGTDLRKADLFVGTSAGSVVGAVITSGVDLETLFQQQIDPQKQVKELVPAVDFLQWRKNLSHAKEENGGAVDILKRIGKTVAAAKTVAESERRAVIAARLPVHTWPEQKLLVAAVDVESGERCVFERNSGVNLVDAVEASCAVPATWPLVTIGNRRYMDGGMYSTENADLAVGFERVLILALTPSFPPMGVVAAGEHIKILQHSGARVEVVHPDLATEKAFAAFGGNLLNPAVRESAARAGREQGLGIAERIGRFWGEEED